MMHGKLTTYVRGCRCPECKDAQYRYDKMRAFRRGRSPLRVPVLGARRRINALRAIGWPLSTIATRLGYVPDSLTSLLFGTRPTMTVVLFNRVASLYDDLSGSPGPSGRVRSLARRQGLLPPLAWDNIDDPSEHPAMIARDDTIIDLVAVERAMTGERISLTTLERRKVIERLRDEGLSFDAVADRLHVTSRTIIREVQMCPASTTGSDQ